MVNVVPRQDPVNSMFAGFGGLAMDDVAPAGFRHFLPMPVAGCIPGVATAGALSESISFVLVLLVGSQGDGFGPSSEGSCRTLKGYRFREEAES